MPRRKLVELVWVEIGSKPLADLHPMTRNVLNELEKRLATGPLSHDAPVAVLSFLRRQNAQGYFGRNENQLNDLGGFYDAASKTPARLCRAVQACSRCPPVRSSMWPN